MHPSSMKVKPGRIAPGAFGHTRGTVKRNYAVMPPEGIMDSYLPRWERTVVRFQAAPQLGARFAQAVLEIAEGGGTREAFSDELERLLYVLEGSVELTVEGIASRLDPEGYVYLPPNAKFSVRNIGPGEARVLGIKKPYVSIGLPPPDLIISKRNDLEKINHNGTEGRTWEHLLPYGDMRFDMELNILSFAPGTHFPDVETHIMEHGLYMLEGQGMYLLDQDWHEVWKDDFIWMGPFCPQLFYPTGWETSAYLLYKDVNRDVSFG